jgi:alkanesulfonate monooxygenase SsuD/methylene tetrahydromethanopterin reductase-like flavin-dependent oxidoreductase (luciferase family)
LKDKAMIDLPAPLYATETVQEARLMQIGPVQSRGGQLSPLPIPRRRKQAEVEAEAGMERPDLPDQDRLAACIAKAALDPEAALADARGWVAEGRDAGQNVRANQCLGLILSNAGDFTGALAAFAQGVAGIPKQQEVAAVPLMTMAGNAALAGGKPDEALGWFDRALAVKDYKDNAALGALQADRARALVALGRLAEAGGALDEVHRLAPEDAEGWLLSATLARRINDLQRAQRDIEIAAKYAPRDPRVGLEAGVIAVLDGRDEAARKSWNSVLAADPDGDAGKVAKGYLDQLGPDLTSVASSEDCGYQRYWVAEHHAMDGIAGGATSVVLAHIGNATSRIRIGSGGIMLPNHTPFQIAEQFGTLDALFPGRIDLGLGRAPGAGPELQRAAQEPPSGGGIFPAGCGRIAALLTGDPTCRSTPHPASARRSQLWMLGSSLFGAQPRRQARPALCLRRAFRARSSRRRAPAMAPAIAHRDHQ